MALAREERNDILHVLSTVSGWMEYFRNDEDGMACRPTDVDYALEEISGELFEYLSKHSS